MLGHGNVSAPDDGSGTRVSAPAQDTPDPAQPTTAALWTAGCGMHERGSDEGRRRRRSYWVTARTHPVSMLVGAGPGPVGTLAGLAVRR